MCLLHGHTIRVFDYEVHSDTDEGISNNNTRGIESKRVFRKIDDTTTRIEDLSSSDSTRRYIILHSYDR